MKKSDKILPHKNTEFLQNLIAPKRIWLYFLLSLLMVYVFEHITNYFIQNTGYTPHPIDTHFYISGEIDPSYIINAGSFGYNIHHYFKSFFVLDLIFPATYTLLFLSTLKLIQGKPVFIIGVALAFAGMILDYSENFSFSIYLLTSVKFLPLIVSILTAVKTVIFILNIGIFLSIIAYHFMLRKIST